MALMLLGLAHAELSVDMPKRRRYGRSSRTEVGSGEEIGAGVVGA